jgi:hypothetical protein
MEMRIMRKIVDWPPRAVTMRVLDEDGARFILKSGARARVSALAHFHFLRRLLNPMWTQIPQTQNT